MTFQPYLDFWWFHHGKRTLIEKGKKLAVASLMWLTLLWEDFGSEFSNAIHWDFTRYFPFSAGKPSRVIHIRNIPNEASDPEVMNLGQQFGRVTNVLVLKGKNQAFLEMADEISATAMVSVFNTTPPTVRGRTVYVQFSNHRELKTDQNHSITVRRTFSIGNSRHSIHFRLNAGEFRMLYACGGWKQRN